MGAVRMERSVYMRMEVEIGGIRFEGDDSIKPKCASRGCNKGTVPMAASVNSSTPRLPSTSLSGVTRTLSSTVLPPIPRPPVCQCFTPLS